MKKIWYRVFKSLRLMILFFAGASSASAIEPESAEATADIMVHCAFLNSQVVKAHGADAAFVSVNYVKWFIGVAGDLTSEAYVIRRIEKEGPMFKKQAEGNTKKFNDELSAGLAQCSKLEFSPAILARLELMVKAKQLGN